MSFRGKSQKQKPVPDERALYEIAVKALARRARSSGEMRQLLGRRKAAKEVIESVIARLREHGYLDDTRFARAFVSSRIENDRQGSRRVERDLAARRVHPEIIRAAVAAGYEDVEERELLRDYLRRKIRLTKPPAKASALASLYRRLLRAGFSSGAIVKELRGLMPRTARGASKPGEAGIDPEKWREWVESLADLPEIEQREEE